LIEFSHSYLHLGVLEIEKNNFYNLHKEEINRKRLSKYVCDCGAILCHSGKARHEKRSQHMSFIKLLNQIKQTDEEYKKIISK